MEIETLTAEAAVLSLAAEELLERDLDRRLCALVRQALLSRGLQVWEAMEASLLQCGDRALLLAWPTETAVYVFSALEDLLQAARGCPESARSALTYADGLWQLFLRCVRGRVPVSLGEFGTRAPGGEALLTHLCEHGELVLAENAVGTLRRYFG